MRYYKEILTITSNGEWNNNGKRTVKQTPNTWAIVEARYTRWEREERNIEQMTIILCVFSHHFLRKI